MSEPVKKKKKKKKGLRWGRIFLALLLVLTIILGIVGVVVVKAIDKQLNSGENTSILILGTDERANQDDPQRSDAMMLANISFNKDNVDLISMPRDSLVYIPCADKKDKITHAFRYGQTACSLDTINTLFDAKVDKYVRVNFDSVIMMVDDLGGITLTATKSFKEWNVAHDHKYTFEKGVSYQMDGEMALAYSRHRKSDSDLFRVQRQQEVLMAMVKKAKSMSIFTIYRLGQKVLDNIDTNVTLMEAMTYYKLATKEDFTITKTNAKGTDYYYGGVYYYQLDKSWIKDTAKRISNDLKTEE